MAIVTASHHMRAMVTSYDLRRLIGSLVIGYDNERKQGRRSAAPHLNRMFHFMVSIVCLLSAYFANRLIVDLARRSGPPRPTNGDQKVKKVKVCI